MSKEKYGFVYIWRDRKHKRYYIGAHWGNENDGYICSSPWMMQAYKRRPEDFKRRILSRIYTNKIDTFIKEQEWLKLIKPEEIKIRYYNLHIIVGHWSMYPEGVKSIKDKIKHMRQFQITSEETKQKMSVIHKENWASGKMTGMKGKTHSEETKKLKSELSKNDDRVKATQFKKGRSNPNKGIPATEEEANRLRELNKEVIWITNGIKETKIKCYEIIPEGWRKGRHFINKNPNVMIGNKNPNYGIKFIWVTNGINNKRCLDLNNIPEGFQIGMTYKGKLKQK